MAETAKLFPLPELKKRWTVSRNILRQMVKSGRLPTVRIGRRRFVHIHAVEKIEATALEQKKV